MVSSLWTLFKCNDQLNTMFMTGMSSRLCWSPWGYIESVAYGFVRRYTPVQASEE